MVFFVIELDTESCTTLKVKVATVNEVHSIKVDAVSTKKILLDKLTISTDERIAKTGIFVLDLTLNPCIFNHICDGHRQLHGNCLLHTVFWCVNRMTGLMSHEKVIEERRDFRIQSWNRKNTIYNIKRCSTNITLFNNNVLCCHQFGEK